MDIWCERVTVEQGGMRIDAFWQEQLEDLGIARNRVQAWIKDGRAVIDGRVCSKPSTRLVPGQTLELHGEEIESVISPVSGDLDILYADESVLVINKNAGVTVHPAPSVTDPTLVHYAAYHFPALSLMSGERPGIVHRLDKDTSGIIVLALDEPSRIALSNAFAERQVTKEYLALVAGVPKEYGRVTHPIGRHPSIKTKMAVVEKGGRDADTEYWRVWTAPDKSASLMRVRIHTGRTHQIRVHMAAEGHPLLGDLLYADPHTAARAPRQMLHSWSLCISHPQSFEPLSFHVLPHQDFLEVLHELCTEPLHIGLTGQTGCGKSTIRKEFERSGIPVFCADEEVARSYACGGDGWKILRHHFGQKFVPSDQDGVDKVALLQAMLESESMRREVERLIHPVVRHALQDFLAAHPKAITLSEIPLLCEAGFAQGQHIGLIASVYCPQESRYEHLARRGWDEKRMAMVDGWQWSLERKIRCADIVIDNSHTLDACRQKAHAFLQEARNIRQRRITRQMDILLDFMSNPSDGQDGEDDASFA